MILSTRAVVSNVSHRWRRSPFPPGQRIECLASFNPIGVRVLTTTAAVINVLADALNIGARAEKWDSSTALLGSAPELDSMAVVTVIGALEDHFGISVADDEVSAELFSTVGTLSTFVESKLRR